MVSFNLGGLGEVCGHAWMAQLTLARLERVDECLQT